MRASKLLTVGGFTSVSAFPRQHGALLSCALCSRSVDARGWISVACMRAVCHVCMADPSAREGEAGRDMAERLARLDELEEKRWAMDDVVIW